MAKKKLFNRMLDGVETVGNALPHPATIFGILALLVAVASAISAAFGVTAVHPGTQETIAVKNLLDGEGIRWMFENVANNFVLFPPLGLVLVAMVGIGVAEGSGLLTVLIRALVLKAPPKLITGALVLAGVLSHLASEAGYVVLIPLGALLFLAIGRHPMAGLAAAFCGVSGGFGANFMIGSIDPVLAGLSTSAAQIIDPALSLSPAANIYFMFVSAIMIVLVGTWITNSIVEPRLGKYEGSEPAIELEQLTSVEKKGMMWAGISILVTFGVLLLTVVPENGILRTPGKDVLHSAFFEGMIVSIMIIFLIPGLVYGIVVGKTKNDKDVIHQMIASMKTMATYIILVFFAAQFVYWFRYSNLGIIIAINGAEILRGIGLEGIWLMVLFIVVSAFINMFMGSASAKWAIMAPVFVPMFMLLGYHPALTQMVFRIGDSLTNVITPMMSYFALIVAFAEKYDERYGIGTIISTMLPYSIVFGIVWTLLLIGWMLLGLPLGPDGPLEYLSPMG
ncbi:MAG: aminobenzoyl-glutamate transporter [Ectothiorhodospiraceae bacterium]|nr:aminobenzoyl-glutamate transporter [Ectothiorhodospiraceae bacterium]